MIRNNLVIYHIAEKFGGTKVWRIYLFWEFREKFDEWIDSSKKFINVSRNLDGLSFMNQGWFIKYAELSPCQTFPLCSMIMDTKAKVHVYKATSFSD